MVNTILILLFLFYECIFYPVSKFSFILNYHFLKPDKFLVKYDQLTAVISIVILLTWFFELVHIYRGIGFNFVEHSRTVSIWVLIGLAQHLHIRAQDIVLC